MKNFTLFLITFIISLLDTVCQEYNFEKIDIHSDRIKCIYQDHKGIIWIGTSDGLVKYLGDSYIIYTSHHDDSNSLSHNIVTSICEDKDSILWIGTRDGLNMFNPKTEEFKSYFKDKHTNGLCHNHIQKLHEDRHGNLWIAGKTGLSRIKRTDKGTIRFIDYDLSHILDIPDKNISIECFFEPPGGPLCMGTKLYGLCILDRDDTDKETFTHYLPDNISKKTTFPAMEEIEPNILIIGTHTNLFWFFDLAKRKFVEKQEITFILNKTNGSVKTYCMHKDETGNLWIGTPNTLNIYNPKKPELLYSTKAFKNGSLANEPYRDQAYTIFEDRDNIIWVSFMTMGIEKYVPKKSVFFRYKTTIKKPGKQRDYIKKIIETNHLLYIATYGDGLLITDKDGKLIKRVNLAYYTKSEMSNATRDISFDKKGRLWIATDNGLHYYNPLTDRIEQSFFMSSNDDNILPKHLITKLVKENDSTIWVLSDAWFKKLNPLQLTFHETELTRIAKSDNPIILWYQDRDGNYWIRYPKSILFYNPAKDTTIHYTPKTFPPIVVASSMCMLHARSGNYWFGTSNALYMYDKENNIFKHFSGNDKFKSNFVLDIEEDSKGRIWILTDKGLTIYAPEKNEFIQYGKQNGLSERADYINHGKNNFFFITDESSFYHFHPDSIKMESLQAPLLLNQFSVSGKPVEISSTPLSGVSIQYKKQIELPYSKNSIGFKFSLLDYSSPKNHTYSYRLLGSDSSWIYIGNNNSVNFTGLSPGRYNLEIKGKAMNKTGESMSPKLSIVIRPPFWTSIWGYSLYGFLGLLAFLIYRFLTIKKMKNEHALLMEKINIEKARELDQLKLNFFFNISHEIRTPLTLISGPLSQLTKQKINAEGTQSLNLIQRNVSRLKEIVNQLLDIGKLEMGKYKPAIIKGNPRDLFVEIIHSFEPFCQKMDLTFHYKLDEFTSDCWYSPDACEKIISNLLSNAIKHTGRGGQIEFGCTLLESIPKDDTTDAMMNIVNNQYVSNSRYLFLEVSDTGEGIDASELSAIFNRFHQSIKKGTKPSFGSGLGLSLTKDLVKQMGGRLYIQSALKKGTKIKVYLPLDRNAFPKNYIEKKRMDHHHEMNKEHVNMLANTNDLIFEEDTSGTNKKRRMNILLVDDNEDLLMFLKGLIKKHYHVIMAKNGNEAIHKIRNTSVDMVISDIMMPEMDGLELCKTIKSDVSTSHIPIILLTAKSSEEDEIKGLKIGVEDYISKPFSPEALLLRVSNIIESRKKIQEKIDYGLELIPVEDKLTDYDNYLLNKILETIRENISDSDLGPEKICNAVGISQSHLYRKVNALANQSVKELIRNIRLNKASEILREGKNVSINNLAYSLGFSTPGYFIKMFRKKFGVTPKAYNNKP